MLFCMLRLALKFKMIICIYCKRAIKNGSGKSHFDGGLLSADFGQVVQNLENLKYTNALACMLIVAIRFKEASTIYIIN